MRWGRLKTATLAAALTAGGGAVWSCAVNPVTGERQLALISESQEIQIGREGAQDVERSIGLVPETAVREYVSRIATGMAARSERPQLPWHFSVVDDPTPNAFALPGGFIYVTRGLLAIMNSEAELASVLGHEIGHVTARHSVTMISRAQLAQLGLGIGSILVPGMQQFGDVAGAGLQLLFLRYGRQAEHQADDLGFRYAYEAGYDVREMANVFAALQRVGEAAGQSPLPSWLSTHPYPEERIQRTNERLAALPQPPSGLRAGREDFLNTISGIVYGDNPRNGFFRDALFLHPDLRFRIAFPSDWRTQNLSQAVLAGSPQQDALIQLTLSTATTPSAAASEFFAARTIQQGQTSQQRINGLPAVIAVFDAQTDGGALRGIAAFISHEGRVYQILGYTPTAQFTRYQGVIQQSLGSFAVLTDPQALAVQPNRIRIVRVPQAMTLTQFHQQYPSVIPIAELALINQVEGPASTLAAGRLVKRVVSGGG